ncbi:MAG TPA: hypothetical protein VMM13_00510 [Euzebya sp.]|nr:hypothetical protein [Euzebya sp.]
MDNYEALGLTGNPFVAEATPGVSEGLFIDVGLPSLPRQGVVELVGCKGAGKTTNLLRWCRLAGGRYFYVRPGLARIVPPPVAQVAVWDEVDRLPRMVLRSRLSAARRAGALVLLGTHVPTGMADVSHELPAPDTHLVTAFFRRRVAAAAISGRTPILALDPHTAEDVAATSNGCWWTVGTHLHIHTAQAAASAGRDQTTWR